MIPNYNKGSFIKETLDSVLNQSFSNWECIIVDDHSTDDSWEIMEVYAHLDSRFKIFKRPLERRKGGNAARNFGFEQSKGEYINWLDSDDILSENFLDDKLMIFHKEPQLDLVYSDIREFTENIKKAKVIDRLDLLKDYINPPLEYMRGNFWIQTGLPLFKKSYLKNYSKYFDENLLMGQEAEFFIRLLLDKPNLKFCPDSIMYYRRHQESYMTNFYQLPFSEKYLLTYLPNKLHFIEFWKKNKLTPETLNFFRNVFNDMLLFLPVFSTEFWDLLFLGTRHNLFKGRFQGVKILGIRVLKSVKLI
nr:glycosyltransferase [Aquiflexum lacus]